jgi:hypothetical protein
MVEVLDIYSEIQGEKPLDKIIKHGFPSKENGAYPITSDELNYFYGSIFQSLRENWGTLKPRLAVDIDMDEVLDAGMYLTALITSDECNKQLPHEYDMKNYPSTIGGFVIVARYKDFIESDTILQKVIDYSGAEYNRVKAGGQWSEWKNISATSGTRTSEGVNWEDIEGKPNEFTPSSHNHDNYLGKDSTATNSSKLENKTLSDIKSEIKTELGGDGGASTITYKVNQAKNILLPETTTDLLEVVIIHQGGDFLITVDSENANTKLMGEVTPMTIKKMSYTKFIYDKDDDNWLVIRGEL